MAVPSYDQFVEPVLRHLAANPRGMVWRRVSGAVVDALRLSETDRAEYDPFRVLLRAYDVLERAGLARKPVGNDHWQLTEAGLKFARKQPSPLPASEMKELLRDFDEPRYQQWAELLGLTSPDPLEALVTHYLEAFRRHFAPLLGRVPDERQTLREAIVIENLRVTWRSSDAPQPLNLTALMAGISKTLFYGDLFFRFLDGRRKYHVSVVDELRRSLARWRENATTDGERVAGLELESRLRAAEAALENWDTLGPDDFQLDPPGEFFEGRTERGKAALKDHP